MKKIVFILIMILVMPLTVSANYIGEFTRNINISLNCEFCSEDTEKTATFQLFANGEMVEGASIVLNEENEFKGSFIKVISISVNLFFSKKDFSDSLKSNINIFIK